MGLVDRMRALIAMRLRERRTARALLRTKHRAIGTVLNHQMVKITGRLRPHGGPILAPLTGRPCAYYSIAVERLGELLIIDEDGCDFILEDDTGRALVHARSKQTKVLITKDANTWVGPLDRIDRELEAFLRWHGRVQHRILGIPQPLLFREGVLEEGELVTAYGVGVWEKDPDPNAWSFGYRDFPRRLTLDPLPDGRLHVSDVAELCG